MHVWPRNKEKLTKDWSAENRDDNFRNDCKNRSFTAPMGLTLSSTARFL